MQARVRTVAFQGVDVLPVDVQVMIAPGNLGLRHGRAWPTRRWAKAASGCGRRCGRWAWRCRRSASRVNLSPADLAKEGSHYDLPIALALLAAMGVLAGESLEGFVVLGELALDGSLSPRAGRAAGGASPRLAAGRGVICPRPAAARRRGPASSRLTTSDRPPRRRALAARPDQPSARPADPAARRRPLIADDRAHLSRPGRDQGPGDAPSACSRSRRPAATTC